LQSSCWDVERAKVFANEPASPTMWGPLIINWFINPLTIDISTIFYNNPQLWKLQTNLANYGAPHCIFLVMALQPLFPAEMTICDCWKFDELSQTGYGCGFKTGPTMSYIS
jgi:hypothetical protein